ncbi:unnamed protein product [Peniophora sp. CBMAI 1063]|nr:unnamed protein product [Peniophora sp. CBMAI 1063]
MTLLRTTLDFAHLFTIEWIFWVIREVLAVEGGSGRATNVKTDIPVADSDQLHPTETTPDDTQTIVTPWVAREQQEEHRWAHLRADTSLLLLSQEQRSINAAEIYQEADALARIANLLRQRADYVAQPAVLRLPPEVFLIIASFVADAEPPSAARFTQRRHSLFAVDNDYIHTGETFNALDDDGSLRPATIGWVKLAHVCRNWRYLCSNAPELWARGIGCLPSMLLEAMQRAGDHVPYDICVRTTLSELEVDTLSAMLTSRGRSLDWVLKDPTQSGVASGLLSGRDLPALTYLRVKTPYRTSFDVVPVYAPFTAPRLAEIDMAFILVPFIAPALTSLQLYYVQMPPSMLLDVFRRSPLLRIIDVSMSWGTHWKDADFPDISEKSSLPHLETLQLSARNIPGTLIARLLRSLTTTSKVEVELACACEDTDDISELWETVRKTFWQEAQPWHLIMNPASVKLRMAEHIQCSRTAACGGRLQRGHLDFGWQRRLPTETLLRQAFTKPSLSPMFKDLLSVDVWVLSLPSEEWRAILTQLSSVRSVSVDAGREDDIDCTAFFQALAPDAAGSEPLPRLTRLTISTWCKTTLADVVSIIKRRSTYAERFGPTSVMQKFLELRLGVLDLRWKASPTLTAQEVQDAITYINAVVWHDGWIGGPQSTSLRADNDDLRRGKRFVYNSADGSRVAAFCQACFGRACQCGICQMLSVDGGTAA